MEESITHVLAADSGHPASEEEAGMVRQLLTKSVDMHTRLTSFAEGLQERYVLMRLRGRNVEAEVIAGVIRDFDRCTEYCYAREAPTQGVPQ